MDIGTTSVVLYLADGRTGETIRTESMLNPQTEFGADVISRASAAMNGKLKELADSIRGAINGLLETALSRENLVSDDVYSMTLVGNTCMHHLFLGIDPKSLVLSPYVPAIDTPLCLDAKDYGIRINGRGKLIFLRKIVRGAADDSYGIEVAKLAGVPDGIIARAKAYLKELEAAGAGLSVEKAEASDQISLIDVGADEVKLRLQSLDINSITPLEALGILSELKKKVD